MGNALVARLTYAHTRYVRPHLFFLSDKPECTRPFIVGSRNCQRRNKLACGSKGCTAERARAQTTRTHAEPSCRRGVISSCACKRLDIFRGGRHTHVAGEVTRASGFLRQGLFAGVGPRRPTSGRRVTQPRLASSASGVSPTN